MKSIVFIAAAIISSSAFADIEGEYVKKGASVGIAQVGKYAAFAAVSNVGQYACDIEATAKEAAEMLTPEKLVWTSREADDKCVVVMSFKGNTMTMTTKDCDSYCGLHAQGSLDGTYKLKRKK